LTPYNKKPTPALAGDPYSISQTVYTGSIIQDASAVYTYTLGYGAGQIVISFTGFLTTVMVYRSNDTSNNLNTPDVYNGTGTVTDNQLSYNTDYCYNIVPYNKNNEAGPSFPINQLFTTIPFVKATADYIYDKYNDQWDIKIIFVDPDSQYAYVIITIEDFTSSRLNAQIKNYIYNNVSDSTSYTIGVTPYNRLDISGVSFNISLDPHG
jgi:hypothetical protein